MKKILFYLFITLIGNYVYGQMEYKYTITAKNIDSDDTYEYGLSVDLHTSYVPNESFMFNYPNGINYGETLTYSEIRNNLVSSFDLEIYNPHGNGDYIYYGTFNGPDFTAADENWTFTNQAVMGKSSMTRTFKNDGKSFLELTFICEPYYEFEIPAANARITCNTSIPLSIESSICYTSLDLEVKPYGGSWKSIRTNISNRYFDLKYSLIEDFVDYGEEFDIRIKHPDGEYSEIIDGLLFLEKPSLTAHYNQRKCSDSKDGVITVSGLTPPKSNNATLRLDFISYAKDEVFENQDSLPNGYFWNNQITFVDNVPKDSISRTFTEMDLKADGLAEADYSGLAEGLCTIKFYYDDGSGSGSGLCSADSVNTVIKHPNPIEIANFKPDYYVDCETNDTIYTTQPGGNMTGTFKAGAYYPTNYNLVSPKSGSIDFIDAGQYRFSGIPISTSEIIVNVNSCDSETLTINYSSYSPKTLTIEATGDIVNVSCHGEATGEIPFKIKGGIGPFSIELYDSSGSYISSIYDLSIREGSFSNLEAGEYYLEVTDNVDANNIFYKTSSPISITEPSELSVSAGDVSNVTCNGGNDGSITLTAEEGTSPYKYSLTEDDYTYSIEDEYTYSNLSSGTYTGYVKDANGCKAQTTSSFVIIQPSALSITEISKTGTTCDVASNGSYSFSVSGGLSTALDSLSVTCQKEGSSIHVGKITGDKDELIITELGIGNHNISVTNNSGCRTDTTISISKSTINSDLFSIEVDQNSIIQPICDNKIDASVIPPIVKDTSGSITININNGTFFGDKSTYNGGYKLYIGDNGEPENKVFNGEIQGLNGTDTYTFTIEDAQGCSATLTNYRVGLADSTLVFDGNITTDNSSCLDGEDGAIHITVSGGKNNEGTATQTYSYGTNLNNLVFADTTSFSIVGKVRGNYDVYVRDEAGCIITAEDSIGYNPINPVTIFDPIYTSHYYCPDGQQGAFSVIATTVNANNLLEYSLGGAIVHDNKVSGDSVFFDNISAGTQTLEVKDKGSNCSDTKEIVINDSTYTRTINTSIINELACDSANNGALQVSIEVGSLESVASKSFTYVLKDSEYPENPEITADVDSSKLIRKYYYLNGNDYSLEIEDNHNCKTSLSNIQVNTSVFAVDTANVVSSPVSSEIASNGSISISAIQGVIHEGDSYSFELFKGVLANNIYDYNFEEPPYRTAKGSTVTFEALSIGEYKVRVIDSEQCSKLSDAIAINVIHPQISITQPANTQLNCYGDSNASISFDINDKFIGSKYKAVLLAYNLSTNNYEIQSVLSVEDNLYNISFDNLGAGRYIVQLREVMEVDGSENVLYEVESGVVEITQPNPLTVTTPTISCVTSYEGSNGSYTIEIEGGTTPYFYSFTKNGEVVNELQSNNSVLTFSNLLAGTYQFKIRDVNNCLFSDGQPIYEDSITITEPSAQLAISANITHESCYGAEDGNVVLNASGGWLCSENTHANCTNQAHLNCPSWQAPQGLECLGSDYLYSLDGSSWQCNPVYDKMPPGTYTFWVKDKAGNTKSIIQSVNERLEFILNTPESFPASCPGYSNGRVTASLENGVPDSNGKYSFTISSTDEGSSFVDVNISKGVNFEYNHLPKGNYKLSVSDLNGCSDSKLFSIGEPTAPEIIFMHNYIRDKGDNTGEFNLNIENGNGVFDYKVSYNGNTIYPNDADFVSDYIGEIAIYELLAGTYTIEIRDTAHCAYEGSEWLTRTITIEEPENKFDFLQKEINNVTCNKFNNGSVNFIASGGWGSNYTYSLNGGELQSNGVYTDLIPGNYSIVIADTVNVNRTFDFEITEPDTFTVAIADYFDASCPNYANGRVLATTQNGMDATTGLKYAINNIDTPELVYGEKESFDRNYTFNALPKGYYELSVVDSNSCYASDFFYIDEPDTALISYTYNYIEAKGDNTGEISVNITNGNGVFNYEWFHNGNSYQSGQTTGSITINQLHAGEYRLEVQDTAACIYESAVIMERSIQMREPEEALSFILDENIPVACNGESNGSLQLTPIGGWGDYSFAIDGAPHGSSGLFSNLSAGFYIIEVSDSVGISWESTIEVQQPEVLSSNYFSHKDINCNGGSDGEIVLDINGGNGAYQVSLDEVNWINGNTVDSLKVGDYSVYVRDAKECATEAIEQSLTQPSKIIIESQAITESRCTNSEGIIDVRFTGGVGSYTYQWYRISDDNQIDLLDDETKTVIENIPSSRYKIEVTDEHNCTLPFSFAVADITDLEISNIKTQAVSCFGYSDGWAEAEVINGNMPYTYSWPVEITNENVDYVDHLEANEYELFVRDNKGCAAKKKFAIGTPEPLLYDTVTYVQPLCYGGAQGFISLQATGGTASYNYLWSNGETSKTISGIEPGNYQLLITDSHACEANFDINLTYQRSLLPSMGNDTLICNYDSIKIDVGSYNTYLLESNAGFSSSLAQPYIKEAASYYLTVTDVDNCLGYDTLNLAISNINIDAIEVTNVSCNNFANGAAEVTVSPANWNHVIAWPDATSNNTWQNLNGGKYSVSVTDDYGCVSEKSFSVYEPDTLEYSTSSILDPLCLGNLNGSINGAISGGVLPYNVAWNNGETSQSISKLDTGYYRIDITDANNCFYQKEFNLSYIRTLEPFVGIDTLICHYDVLPLDAGNYNKINWSSLNGYSSKKRYVEIDEPDTYYLEVTDTDQCLGYDTIKVDVSYLTISATDYMDVTCNGDADGWANITVSPSTWLHNILWSNDETSNKIENLKGGDYSVNVSDAYGCEDNKVFSIYEPDALSITDEFIMDPYCFGVPDGKLELSVSGGRTPYNYDWAHGDSKSSINKLDTATYVLDLYDDENCHLRRTYPVVYQKTIFPYLGDDITICEGNTSRLYPGEFESYAWSSITGITSVDTALIVNSADTYFVEVSDWENCIGRDTISVSSRNTAITPEFLMASSVPMGDTLMIIEVSQPKPQNYNWIISGSHQITEQTDTYCKIIFEEEGNFEIILNAETYNCSAQTRKTVLVTPELSGDDIKFGSVSDNSYSNIISWSASPNPATDIFAANLELREAASATLYLVDIGSGQIVETRKVNGLDNYSESFNVFKSGMYAVFAEVGVERRVVKVVVN